MDALIEDISRNCNRQEESNETEDADDIDESLSDTTYRGLSQLSIAYKEKCVDKRVSRCFEKACKSKSWCESIDGEYNALVKHGTCEVIPLESGMDPIQYTWDFRLKKSPGTSVQMIYKARCCFCGDKEKAYRYLDPEAIYVKVARHQTFRIHLSKVAAKYLILEGADISKTYLYGDLESPVIMQLPMTQAVPLRNPAI